MNSTVRRIVMTTVAALMAQAPRAMAQSEPSLPPTRSHPVCDPDTKSLYVTCALWLDMGKLRRGATGDVIARQGITPIPLVDLVKGDSAREYASRYEQLGWIAAPMRLLAIAGLATGYTLSRRHCQSVGCSDESNKHAARIWATSGASLFVLSIPILGAANRDAGRAVWWNNALLRTAP